ncbi:MAG: pirin family protein, partial [Polyangiaceae bacterium]
RVQAGKGFGTHGHKDMEIVSYVLEGKLAHKDSMGTGSVLEPGDVQRMSAGTGVRHSEFNGSDADEVHFLQIWIQPDQANYAPGSEEKHFSEADKRGRLRLVASNDGRESSVTLHQDTSLYAGLFDVGESADFDLAEGRHAWVHVARGSVNVNGETLKAGDAAAIDEAGKIHIEGDTGVEVLFFDLA